MLKEQIQKDMLEAAKKHDQLTLDTLRMLKAAIIKFETSGKEKIEANDEQVQQTINKEIKSRKDSVEQFRAGNREEMAKKEESEIKILEKYLPEQLSETELRGIIQEVITQTGATAKSDLGRVMGALMPRVKGKADGGLVNRIVQEILK